MGMSVGALFYLALIYINKDNQYLIKTFLIPGYIGLSITSPLFLIFLCFIKGTSS